MSRSRRQPSILREQALLLALIAAMFLIWLGQALGPEDWDRPFTVVPAHIVESWHHLRAGAIDATDLARFGTLLSYAFLHGDIGHVFFNMLYLWIFAALAIRHLGRLWFVLIFVLTAIGGGIAHTLLDPTDTTSMLGASGAVMGFEGAYLGLAVRYRLADPHIWPMAHPIPPGQLAALGVIGVAFDFRDVFLGSADFIAHGAHIGGFVVGLFITSLVRIDEEPR